MFPKRIALLFILFACSFSIYAQIQVNDHAPKKASIYAAIIPGAGQFYNKKYWKIPIVYLSLGSALYVAKQNQNEYLHYRQAFEYRTDDDETTIDPYVDQYTESNLITEKNIRRENRDLAYIIAAGIYLLNIIDASVDAHLFKFNVNDDISLNIQPQFMQASHQNTLALSLKLNWN